MGSKALVNGRHEAFCHEYLLDLNIAQAALRAGFAELSARQQGSKVFARVEVQDRIQYLKSERIDRVKINADYVLNRLVEVDQMDLLDIVDDAYNLRPIGEWPLIWRQFVSGIENLEQFEGFGEDRTQSGWLKKIKWPDKVKNLELLGKHIAVNAFRETVEVSGSVEVSLSNLMDELEDSDL